MQNEEEVKKVYKATTSHTGAMVRGQYRRIGTSSEWERMDNPGRRWIGGELLPDRINIEQGVVYPVDDERYPVSITLGALPWRCAGGHFRHLLCGDGKPSLGTWLMHRVNSDEREVYLITNAKLITKQIRTLAKFAVSMVTSDPLDEQKLMRDVHVDQFEDLPQSNALPQLVVDMD
jgi:hypothetical protein